MSEISNADEESVYNFVIHPGLK